MLAQIPPQLRLTLVDNIGTPADGGSLAGQNVNAFPDGALFYVANTNRFYRLKKNLPTGVIADSSSNHNVVGGVGSSLAAGFFVACQQQGVFTMTAGSATVSGLDLSTAGSFLVSYVTISGTAGTVHGAITNVGLATFTSNQGSDASTMVFVFVETGTEA